MASICVVKNFCLKIVIDISPGNARILGGGTRAFFVLMCHAGKL